MQFKHNTTNTPNPPMSGGPLPKFEQPMKPAPFEDPNSTPANENVNKKTGRSENAARDAAEAAKVAQVDAERPAEDVMHFLQRIGQKLKNARTDVHPATATEVAEEINLYVSKLGSGKVNSYRPK